jgi:hypothetical protein
MSEFAIWGVPPDVDPDSPLAETLLHTMSEWPAPTIEDARKVAAVLEARHGCKRVRIQSLADGGSVQDMLRGAVRGNRR